MPEVPRHRPAAALKTLDRSPDALTRARFYKSKAWKRLRAIHLVRDPLCRRCLEQGFATRAEAVHHVETIEANPDRALDPTNLESICARCHYSHHRRPNPS